MLALSILSFCGFVALSLYVAIPLDLPQALWAFLPMLIMPLGFLWGWHNAKRKRIEAEREVERYRAGLRQAIADQ